MDDGWPFDASEALLRDKSEPHARWRTVSLVTALRELVVARTAGDDAARTRREALEATADELRRRGIDVDSLVRYGLLPEIMAIHIVPVIIRRILPADMAEEIVGSEGGYEFVSSRPTLQFAVKGSIKMPDEEMLQAINAVTASTLAIIAQAPLPVLLKVDPEGHSDIDPEGPREPDMDMVDVYRWLVERFSETFLEDWSTKSLHQEYRWACANAAAPCPEDLMADRVVNKVDLSNEIAKRVVFPDHSSPQNLDPEDQLVARMQVYARTLLEQARCREAAALFEFSLQRRPDDPVLLNNLGFCLILEDSRAALYYLEEAARLRYRSLPIVVYNQMCCYYRLSEFRQALRLAERFWPDGHGRGPCSGVIWARDVNNQWQIKSVDDVRAEIASMAVDICVLEGVDGRTGRWRENLDSITRK